MPRYNNSSGMPVYSVTTGLPAFDCTAPEPPPPPTDPPQLCCYGKWIPEIGAFFRPRIIRMTLAGFGYACVEDASGASTERYSDYDFNRTIDLDDFSWTNVPGTNPVRRCIWSKVQAASHTTTQTAYVGPNCTGPIFSTKTRATNQIEHSVEIQYSATTGFRLVNIRARVSGIPVAGDGGGLNAVADMSPGHFIPPADTMSPGFNSQNFISPGTVTLQMMDFVLCGT